MKVTGSSLFATAMKKEGVDTIFAYPGGYVIDLLDELYDHSDINLVLPRHEQGLIHAADGYARATGKVGVCLVTSGPGATNLVTGIANANYTGYSSPLKNVAKNEGDLYYHYTGDPGVYPSNSVLSDYEEYLYLGETVQAIMDGHWKNLKKADGGVWLYLALVAVLVLVIVSDS